jgi:carboxyl-terminal processing protease
MTPRRTAATLLLCLASAAQAAEPTSFPAEEFDALLATYALVKAQYVEAADDKKLLGGAIAGMLASLDPHSHYLDKDDLAELQKDRAGEYNGIGVVAEMDGGHLYVIGVTEHSPADLAGIEVGDTIVSVDGVPIAGERSLETTRRMRGQSGTTLALGYRHGGAGPVRTAELTRAALQTTTVSTRTLANGIAWIRLSAFEGKTAADLAAALKSLGAAGSPRGIVLDMRNDPGGLITAAVAVAGAFLPPNTLLFSARGHNAGEEAKVTVNPRYYHGPDEPDVLAGLPAWTRTVPLAVLVNGASASAAELVAGALQDNQRARVVGTRSFGKGSIQTVFPLTADSAVKLTVARYFTPKGKEIQARGIIPDMVVAPKSGAGDPEGLALREEDLAQHLAATLPEPEAPAPLQRAAVESTRTFGTADDRALAAAVALLAPRQGAAALTLGP